MGDSQVESPNAGRAHGDACMAWQRPKCEAECRGDRSAIANGKACSNLQAYFKTLPSLARQKPMLLNASRACARAQAAVIKTCLNDPTSAHADCTTLFQHCQLSFESKEAEETVVEGADQSFDVEGDAGTSTAVDERTMHKFASRVFSLLRDRLDACVTRRSTKDCLALFEDRLVHDGVLQFVTNEGGPLGVEPADAAMVGSPRTTRASIADLEEIYGSVLGVLGQHCKAQESVMCDGLLAVAEPQRLSTYDRHTFADVGDALVRLCESGRYAACRALWTLNGASTPSMGAADICRSKTLADCWRGSAKPDTAWRERYAQLGLAAASKACAGGDAEACEVAGDIDRSANRAANAEQNYAHGCDHGRLSACQKMRRGLAATDAVAAEDRASLRRCEAGDMHECMFLSPTTSFAKGSREADEVLDMVPYLCSPAGNRSCKWMEPGLPAVPPLCLEFCGAAAGPTAAPSSSAR